MKDISFEKAMQKLEKIVGDLENGELSLDDSLKKYEEGVKLSVLCRQKLDKARQKIETLAKDASGNFIKKPFKKKEDDE